MAKLHNRRARLLPTAQIACLITSWLFISNTLQAGGGAIAQTRNFFVVSRHSDEVVKPDLAAISVAPTEFDFLAGREIPIYDTTINFGCTPSPQTVTRYFISKSPNLDLSSAQVLGERSVPSLKPGEENRSSGSQRYALPPYLSPGEYYVFACADAENKVPEVSESNNCSNVGEYVRYECGRLRTDIQRMSLDSLGTEVFDPGLRGLGLNSRTVSYDDLVSRFGEALNVSVRKEQNYDPPPEGYDHITWERDGLVIEMIASSQSINEGRNRKLWLERIKLSSSQYTLKHGLKIGLPRALFLTRIGKPNSDYGGVMRYECEQPVCQIELDTDQDDKVKKISWTWYEH